MRYKSIKDSLSHLNDCYLVFEKISLEKLGRVDTEYIKLLLKSYVNSSEILDLKEINGGYERDCERIS